MRPYCGEMLMIDTLLGAENYCTQYKQCNTSILHARPAVLRLVKLNIRPMNHENALTMRPYRDDR